MNEENVVSVDNSNPQEVVAPEATSETGEEVVESPEELKDRLSKAEDLAKNYKIRAEKAEKAAKEKPPVDGQSLTPRDSMALFNAKVHEDDVDQVVKYAKFNNVSVAEALKDSVMQGILGKNIEQRNTAEAADAGSGRRGSYRVSDDMLVSNASRNKLPETDSDIERLIKLKSRPGK